MLADEFEEEEEEEEEDDEAEEDAVDRMKNDLNEIYDNDTNRLSTVKVRPGVVRLWDYSIKFKCILRKNERATDITIRNIFSIYPRNSDWLVTEVLENTFSKSTMCIVKN